MNLAQNKNHPSLISLNLHRASFTLVELLVVLALVAILSVVVVMTLNPAELLKQARDSNRLSDLATINTALNLFSTDVIGGFMGTSTVVYVSLPDNSSSTCGSWGLPALPAGYTYNCVTSQNLRNTDGTGWIPVNFQRISSNSPISQLPIDPQNTTSTGNYYTYVTGGSWMLTAIPESQKQKAELSTNPHITNYPGAIGMGNNLSLSPLFSSNGLVGYWKFDEGSGTTVKDSSGNGNNGLWGGGGIHWVAGRVGVGSGQFSVGNSVSLGGANILNQISTNHSLTYVAWIYNSNSSVGMYDVIVPFGYNPRWSYSLILNNGQAELRFQNSSGAWKAYAGGVLPRDAWTFIAVSYKPANSQLIFYLNNSSFVQSSTEITDNATSTWGLGFGGWSGFTGQMDDLRIYNRALSSSEVSALYNSTK